MKTSAKYFGLAFGPSARQHESKWPQNYFTYDVTHKKSTTPKQKNIFECNLEGCPICLSPWTAL